MALSRLQRIGSHMPVIINGETFRSGEDVLNCKTFEEDASISFVPPNHSRKRRNAPDLIVVHWTGGEGSHKRVLATLRKRNLSVHFVIDRDGQIYQTCDPMLVTCSHVGKFNSRSIGIEIVNYGSLPQNKTPWPLSAIPDTWRDRGVYSTLINNRHMWLADFFAPQKAALRCLLSTLCTYCNIPGDVPVDVQGNPLHRRLRLTEARFFTGICGHYHLSKTKIDPGTKCIDEIHGYMFKRVIKNG